MVNDDSLSATIYNAVVGHIAALSKANGRFDLTSHATISTILNGVITPVSTNTTFSAGMLAEIETAASYSRATESQYSLQDAVKSVVSGATSSVDFAAETLAAVDAGSDGIADLNYAFPSISLGTLTDINRDGRPDTCDGVSTTLGMTEDLDGDNDGILDTADGYPLADIC